MFYRVDYKYYFGATNASNLTLTILHPFFKIDYFDFMSFRCAEKTYFWNDPFLPSNAVSADIPAT